jgi:CRP-like cAMP-binding protein
MHAGNNTEAWSPVIGHMLMTAVTPPIDDLSAIPAGRNGRCNAMQTLDLALLNDILPAEAFRQMSAFGALSDEFVEQVLAAGELLGLTEGEQLYHQGERADCFYVVLKGCLEVYQDTETRREVIHTTCEGESVGFAAMLAMRPRLFSSVATGECIVLKIPCQVLASLPELDGEQFGIFFINLSRDMSRFMGDCIRRLPVADTEPTTETAPRPPSI